MMKRIASLMFCAVLLLVSLSGCVNRISQVVLSQVQREYMTRKAVFAQHLRFTAGGSTCVGVIYFLSLFDPDEENFVDIIFVHSEAAAAGFPDNVLVGWPSENSWVDDIPILGTPGQIMNFTSSIRARYPEIDFRDYGLPENEITLIDVVERWENVNELIQLVCRTRI